jgi:hypothetical protein
MFARVRLAPVCLLAAIGAWPAASSGHEFSDSEALPSIRQLVFSPDAVGFVSPKNDLLGGAPLYFIYDRGNRKIAEVDAAQFRQRFPASVPSDEPRESRRSSPYHLIGRTAGGVEYKLRLKYCGEGGDEDDEKMELVVVGGKPVRVGAREECTSVSSVEIVGDQLWLGTAYSGEQKGYSAAEGVIVQSLRGGRVLARLDAVSGWVTRVRLDPFSKNVWVTTDLGIFEVSPQFRLLSANLYYHDFDPRTGEPRFAFSSEATRGNPLSAVARLLPGAERKGFYEAVSKIPAADLEQFTPYDFFMCCRFDDQYPQSFHPLMPFFVNQSARGSPGDRNTWRQAVCRLGGPSDQYCSRAE